MKNYPNVLKALDEALAKKDSENLLLKYRIGILEKKLAEVEASNKKKKGEVA